MLYEVITIINVRDLFGPTAIVDQKKVGMVIQIEEWRNNFV